MHLEIRYNSLEAKRFSPAKGQLNVNNNSTIVSLEKKKGFLELGFVFTSHYDPNVGMIKVEGILIIREREEKMKKILKEWKASGNKNLPQDIAEAVHSTILANCLVEVTILSRDIHLPAPIPTPRIALKKKEESQGGESKVDYIR